MSHQLKSRMTRHIFSVNFSTKNFPGGFLVYQEMVETSQVYIRDCTVVSPYALLMFGGQIEVPLGSQTVMVGWIKLPCQPRTALLFREARVQLEKTLQSKFDNPSLDLWEGPSSEVIRVILNLITSEGDK